MKKFLSLILAVVLVLTAIPLGTLNFVAEAETNSGYFYLVENGEATITGVDSSIRGDVVIPSTLGGFQVTSIGNKAFYECDSLTSITIPEGVTSIGNEAFEYCYYLKNITIPDGVTSIGNYAFFYCVRLENITIPSSVTSIGIRAFARCYSLKSITIPKGVTSIGDAAFSVCESLVSVEVDEDNPKFYSKGNCLIDKELGSVILGIKTSIIPTDNNVTSIADEAFCGCYYLTNIVIPNNIKKIGKDVFGYCGSLLSIKILNPSIIFEEGFFDIESFPDFDYIATIYGYSGSTTEEYALRKGLKFISLDGSSSKYKSDTLGLYYSYDKNNIELGDTARVGADYLRGNSLGMKYDGDIRWEVSDPDVLQIEYYSTNAAWMSFKAIGLGSCDIILYLEGKEAVYDTINIKVSDKTLLEQNSEYVFNSSVFSTLETARNTCKEIINTHGGFNRGLSAFMHNVENGLGVDVITKEALAAVGLTTSMAEDAEDKATEKLLMELIGSEDLVGDANNKIEKIYKIIKSPYKTAAINEKTFFELISENTSFSVDQIKGFHENAKNFLDKADIAFDVLDVTTSAILISQFEVEVIKDMRDAASYGSSLYNSLNRLYNKRLNLTAYATDKFLNEQAIDLLNDFIGEFGGATYKIGKALAFWVNMLYKELGGLQADDYLVAQNSCAYAGYLYNYTLRTKATAENFERYYKYYVSAVKSALKSALDICQNNKLRNKANGLYEQIGLTCNNEGFFDQVRNDLNNVCAVSKETVGNGKVLACYGGGISSYSLYNTSYTNVNSYENTLSIPSYIEGSRIEGIADYGFAGTQEISGITLPKTIEIIGQYAFSNSSAEFVHFNLGLTEIGEGAFWNSSQLEVLTFPETLKVIGSDAFSGCYNLGDLTFSENLEAIGDYAFENCTGVQKITFYNPNTVISLSAFTNCSNLYIVEGYKGSTAEIFAQENGLDFQPIERSVSEMRIINPATQKNVVSGEAVLTDGLSIEVIYADNTSEIITNGWALVCDTYSVGEQMVYICYKDATITYPITVTKREIGNIELSEEEINLFISDTYQLIVNSDINLAYGDIIWSSDNPAVAEVSNNGYITSYGLGTATIIATTKDGKISDSCEVTVVNKQSFESVGEVINGQLYSPMQSGYYSFYVTDSTKEISMIIYNHNGDIISANYGINPNVSVWLVDNEAYFAEIYTESGNEFHLIIEETEKQLNHTYDNLCDIDCNICGEIREISHNFEWIIDSQNNCGVEGYKHEECTVCGVTRNENTVISATGNHIYDNDMDEYCNNCNLYREVCKYGDASGDGKINSVDLAMLRQYLAYLDFITGESTVEVSKGADANGDGVIDAIDLAMLRTYLANLDLMTGESSVILGPRV